MKEKRGKYWYTSVLNMVKHFKQIKTDPSDEAQRYYRAILEAMKETSGQAEGIRKVNIVKCSVIDRTHTISGAALKYYVSERTAQQWVADFIYLVGSKVGY